MNTYNYPVNGASSETRATLEDGRTVTVNTQYSVVNPTEHKHSDCSAMTKIGGTCDCGALDGIDTDALVKDARENGLFGTAPKAEPTEEQVKAAAEADERYESDRAEVLRRLNQ